MALQKTKLTILQGASFRQPIYYYDGAVEIVKPIVSLTTGYPTVINAPGHGLPDSEVPVALFNVGSLSSASKSARDRYRALKLDVDTCSIQVNTQGLTGPITGAVMVFNPPFDLSTWSARMQVRESIDATEVIETFSSVDGNIILGADGLIELLLNATETDALTFTSAVWDLEVVDPTESPPFVSRIAAGTIELSKQVTR